MANLKDLRRRIRSTKSSQKITSAMKMVSASKLRRAQIAVEQARPYSKLVQHMVADLSQAASDLPHLLTGRSEAKTHLLILFGSDRGLCGGLNTQLARLVRRTISDLEGKNQEVVLWISGKKLEDQLRKDYSKQIAKQFHGLSKKGAQFLEARHLAQQAETSFLDKTVDQISIIFTRFVSAIKQEPTVLPLIPLVHMQKTLASENNYAYEPEAEIILEDLSHHALETYVFHALLESYASEQGARMQAMDNATRNAQDMINRLTLIYNRNRQALITKELIEIISGAEALAK